MRASTVRLYFALLAAKGEGVFIAKHDRVRHLLEVAALLFQHVAQADSERVGCGGAHLFLSSVFLAVACDIHAERPGEGGGSKLQGEGCPHPLKRRRSRNGKGGGLHKRSAEDWGSPLWRAIGAEPLSQVCLPCFARGSVPD
jgi:hypothetical protein